MEGKAECSSQEGTHIHDLTEDILVTILSLVGHEDLPIRRPPYRDLKVCHPLQCALVCRRWRSCAPAAVYSAALDEASLAHLAEQAGVFTGLRRLRLPVRLRVHSDCDGMLPRIAAAIPHLEALELNLLDFLATDVSAALATWRHIKELNLTIRGHHSTEWLGLVPLLDVISTMTSLERLSFAGSNFDPAVLWERLGPHLMQLKELGLQCTAVPPLAMAAIPSLRLQIALMQAVSLPHPLLHFRNIVELCLKGFGGEELPTELGSMGNLERLRISRAPGLVTLPSSIGRLAILKVLTIKHCNRLTRLPASIGHLQELRALHLYLRELTALPETLGQLTSLQKLHLDCMDSLDALPEGLGELCSLEDFRLCSDVSGPGRALPERVRELSRLTKLVLEEWGELPDSVGSLTSLREMVVAGLQSASLPETLGELTALATLRVLGCRSIRSLPESMGSLGCLNELHIGECWELAQLPLALTELTNLKELVIKDCYEFSDRLGVIPRMQSLRFLWLAGCHHEFQLPDGLENLTALQRIQCSRLPYKLFIHRYPRLYKIMVLDHSSLDQESMDYAD